MDAIDIFVRNLPEQMTERQVQLFITPHFERLGIFVFRCHKLKSKGCATLTILDSQKGQKFLQVHGQKQPGHLGFKQVAQKLFHQNRGIQFLPGKNQPDKYTLSSLQKQAEDQRKAAKTQKSSKKHPGEDFHRVYDVVEMYCGQWDFEGHQLVFSSYYQTAKFGQIIFTNRTLHISFPQPSISPDMSVEDRLEIPYYSIQSFVTGSLEDPCLSFSLRMAPKIYSRVRHKEDPEQGLVDLLRLLSLDFSMPKGRNDFRERLTALDQRHEAVVSGCHCYRFRLRIPKDVRNIQRLRKISEIPDSISIDTSIINPTPFAAQMTRLNGVIAGGVCQKLPFEVKFQIQKLAQNGFLSPGLVAELASAIASEFVGKDPRGYADAIKELQSQLPFRGPDADSNDFTLKAILQTIDDNAARFREAVDFGEHVERHDHIMLVHKARVTPTGIFLEGPTPETRNRVLRKYSDFPTYFLSVSFEDEDSERLHHDAKTSNTGIYRGRFKGVLEGNITIAARPFEFLGFSHSSLRAHTCWYMAPFVQDNNFTHARLVISGLGDFTHIRSPAKCAARIGQAFSQTLSSVPVPPEAFEVVPDVERNGRCFSDGVGTCSQDLLHSIWDRYSNRHPLKPTILQIRFRGAKGVVSLDSRLQGMKLRLRRSMIKFEGSTATEIEICGSAVRPLPMYLNRQMIKILEDLGIAGESFLRLQARAVEKLRAATLSVEGAALFLQKNDVGMAARIPWLLRRLEGLGLNFQADDFLRSILEIGVLRQLRELKYRARILVEDGVTLYGIMDETDTLNVGEIYCSMVVDEAVTLVLGQVVITRSPALHPGDIQTVHAVDVPSDNALKDIHNVVVFSSKGDRDLASQLSGGDLDGDIYNIIFDPDLQPQRLYEPADYATPRAVDIGRRVERSDMTNHMIDFMENDSLGLIATLHQILADQEDRGTLSSECIELAQLHSYAVDFSKTGIPVKREKIPKYPKCRPDFLASGPRLLVSKGVKIDDSEIRPINEDIKEMNDALSFEPPYIYYYESPKILGRLYRNIDEHEFLGELQAHAVNNTLKPNHTVVGEIWNYVRKMCELIQWEHHVPAAQEIKQSYEENLVDSMLSYATYDKSYVSEVEVFSGMILGRNGAQSKRQREYSVDMNDKHKRDVAYTVACILNGLDGEDRQESLPRSVACLFVGLTADRSHKRVGALVSFAWIAAVVCLDEVDKMAQNKPAYQVL